MEEERADAKGVSGQKETLRATVVAGEGELPFQVVYQSPSILFPKMNEDLRVGLGFETMPAVLQVNSEFPVIENLAVEDGYHGVVLVAERLLSSGEIDDRKAAGVERDLGFDKRAALIGTAMLNRSTHRL